MMVRISPTMVIGTIERLLEAELVDGFYLTEDDLATKVVWLSDRHQGYTTWNLSKVEQLLELVMVD
jgi:hypothetical protein